MTEMQNYTNGTDYQPDETYISMETIQAKFIYDPSTQIVQDEKAKPKQKFRSRHFPEPFWGHDD